MSHTLTMRGTTRFFFWFPMPPFVLNSLTAFSVCSTRFDKSLRTPNTSSNLFTTACDSADVEYSRNMHTNKHQGIKAWPTYQWKINQALVFPLGWHGFVQANSVTLGYFHLRQTLYLNCIVYFTNNLCLWHQNQWKH